MKEVSESMKSIQLVSSSAENLVSIPVGEIPHLLYQLSCISWWRWLSWLSVADIQSHPMHNQRFLPHSLVSQAVLVSPSCGRCIHTFSPETEASQCHFWRQAHWQCSKPMYSQEADGWIGFGLSCHQEAFCCSMLSGGAEAKLNSSLVVGEAGFSPPSSLVPQLNGGVVASSHGLRIGSLCDHVSHTATLAT